MHVLLVADGRSPTTRGWIRALLSFGCQVTLVSTYPCAPVEGVEASVCLPVAFASLAGGSVSASGGGDKTAVNTAGQPAGNAKAAGQGANRALARRFRGLFLAGRYRFGPLTLPFYSSRFRWLAERLQPDLIHALRIPFEGMLAAAGAPAGIPLAVSIWGNDLTLHARRSRQMAELTRKTLHRADALLADAARDVRLARAWGLDGGKPALVVPGSGGLALEEIRAVSERVRCEGSRFDDLFDPAAPLVVNPRGFRPGSVRQDTFFSALPLALERKPEILFACAAMAGQPEAETALDRLRLRRSVRLLPHMPQEHLWELFARAQLTISVSQHDGTPNSLLEAMAAGAFSIAGDIESLREWITPGVNGLLVEPDKPQALAEAMLLALDNPDLRRRAALASAQILEDRAAAPVVREKIKGLYESLVLSQSR